MNLFYKYIFALCIALPFFVLTVMSENNKFEAFSGVENPLDERVSIEKELLVEKNENPRELFTKDGEFFMFFPESEANFSLNDRSLITGTMFWSSSLVTDNKKINHKLPSPLTLKTIYPKVGQMKIGPILINSTKGSVLIKRNSNFKTIKIYAFDHSIEIFFDGATHPFVLPSEGMIHINEDLITTEIDKLSYSDFKKEFKIDNFSIADSEKEDIKKILQALQSLNSWQDKISKFAISEHEKWEIISEKNFLAKIKEVQENIAIGLPDRKKDQYLFNDLIKPFVESYFLVKKNKINQAKEKLLIFKDVLNSDDWSSLMARNDELNKDWQTILTAHKIWLKTIVPDDPEEVFLDFWFSYEFQDSPIQKIEQLFSSAEKFTANGMLRKARMELEKIQPIIDSESFIINDPSKITKMRRLLIELIKKQPSLQTEKIFQLHQVLLRKESDIIKIPSVIDEIALESSKDIIYFLKIFLEDKTKTNFSKILIRSYKMLNIAKIENKLGFDIFTKEEKELIDIIFLIGNVGSTKDEINKLRDELEEQKRIKENINNLGLGNDKKEEYHSSNPNYINGAKKLKEFLEQQEVDTKNMLIRTFYTEKAGIVSFVSNITFNKIDISTNFNHDLQLFKNLKINEKIIESIQPKFFLNILNRETKKDEKDRMIVQTKEVIPQTTPTAIIHRTFVQNLFETKQIIVSKGQIEILDKDMNQYNISNATLNYSSLNFIYDKETNTIFNIEIESSGTKLNIEKNFKIESLPDELFDHIKNLKNKEAEDQY